MALRRSECLEVGICVALYNSKRSVDNLYYVNLRKEALPYPTVLGNLNYVLIA